MAYDVQLAERVREYLSRFPHVEVEEKKMFKGLAFMVNGKMCMNVSGEQLMCRFDPSLTGELEKRNGYLPMIMKGKKYKGYCYVEQTGIADKHDFEYWMNLCMSFNKSAKSSKR